MTIKWNLPTPDYHLPHILILSEREAYRHLLLNMHTTAPSPFFSFVMSREFSSVVYSLALRCSQTYCSNIYAILRNKLRASLVVGTSGSLYTRLGHLPLCYIHMSSVELCVTRSYNYHHHCQIHLGQSDLSHHTYTACIIFTSIRLQTLAE